jgi:hypothetical protein
MTIQRRYEPDPEALERVVDILYRVLADSPDRDSAAAEVGAGSPCVGPQPE